MWFLFAILTSFLYAFYFFANQQSRLKPDVCIIYRGFLIALAATPLMLIYYHVFPWQFYAIVLFQACAISYSDYKYFQAFHKFGAENIHAIKPLSVLRTFVFWLIIKPYMLVLYAKEPVRTLFIVASLLGIVYAMVHYRQQKIGQKSLQFMLPVLLVSSLIDMSNKVITEYNDGLLLVLTFHRVALTGWIIGIINLCLHCRKISDCKKLLKFKNICLRR